MAKAPEGVVVGPCSECRYWDPKAAHLPGSVWGTCLRPMSVGSKTALLRRLDVGGYASREPTLFLSVAPDFGCLQWEVKLVHPFAEGGVVPPTLYR